MFPQEVLSRSARILQQQPLDFIVILYGIDFIVILYGKKEKKVKNEKKVFGLKREGFFFYLLSLAQGYCSRIKTGVGIKPLP